VATGEKLQGAGDPVRRAQMSSNEVITAALLEKISNIQRRAVRPQIAYRAQTRLLHGLRCAATVRGFPALFVDEPMDLGGEDSSPNPMELLLAALGTSQEIIFSAYAAVMGIPLDAVSVNVKGFLDIRGMLAMDESIAAGYQHVSYEALIESCADREEIRKLVGMVEDHCPILDTLRRPIEVMGSVFLNGESLDVQLKNAA
jgi:putative redox protein